MVHMVNEANKEQEIVISSISSTPVNPIMKLKSKSHIATLCAFLAFFKSRICIPDGFDEMTVCPLHCSLILVGELGPAPPFLPIRVLEVLWSHALSLECEVSLRM